MRLDRRAVLRIGGVSLAGVVAGCADQGGDATTNESPAETTETTNGPGEMPTETTQTSAVPAETDTQTTQNGTASPDGTSTETTRTTETTQTATPEPEGQIVEISGMSFSPMEVSIDPGTEVRWINRDGIPHDVESAQFNGGATEWDFESGELEEDEEASYTFDQAGTYEYYCTIHGKSTMCGVVLVGDASRAGPLPCE